MLTKCPLCGSELVCSRTPGTVWCVSTECGAVFHDVDLSGAISRVPQESASTSVADEEKPATRDRSNRDDAEADE